jgi:cellulose synthase operon protein C
MRARSSSSNLAGRLAMIAVLGLAACAGPKTPPVAEQPTLKSLEGRQVTIAPDQGIEKREENAAVAYNEFLKAAPRDPHRQEALRRLGDLEMERVDSVAGGETNASGNIDYASAITKYLEFLKTYPTDPGNDRVLYQLARAYELSGQLEPALKALDRLAQDFPKSRYRDEAQFRRGEVLFTLRDYPKAEQAYGTTMKSGEATPYYERALFMHGWTLFKQVRLEDALTSFFGVLDRKLAGKGEGELDSLPGLTRGDRELVDDTFRVTSLSLENLQGAATIPTYINSPARREYEFRVYQQLGELYIKQDRVKDAADTFAAFAQRQPLHAQAPLMQARVIDIYQRSGFDAKKSYVARYSARSDFQRANPGAWERAQPLVKVHVADLARHYHAAAQKSKKSEDYQEAVRWYRSYLESFPTDPQAAQNNFLLAELLFEDSRYAEASVEYEKAAYQYPKHAKSADAGYAALLAYVQVEKRTAAADLKKVQLAGVDSAIRFSKAFPEDPRNGSVLTNAAEKLYTLNDPSRALAVAQQVVALKPPVAAAQRKVAWTVIAHTTFERGNFDQAEQGYVQVLALTPEKDASRNELTERLAASIYKQGEQARKDGKLRDAVGHFMRVAETAPLSTVRPTAQYDAAAALIALKDWDAATKTLEDFRQRFPRHPLQDDVSSKLAVAYVEKGNWAQAAGEFERLSAVNKDPQLARSGLWQAAEMYEKANSRTQAARVYDRYLKTYPQPLEPAVEARYRLSRMAKEEGNPARELALMKEIQLADLTGGAGRTNRTRYLGATATLALAAPAVEDYRKVALVEPLKTTLKNKKAKFEVALKGYAAAAEYGVADVATAATYQTAELYSDFGKSLLASQRPKNLSKMELEQYNVLLEEQAFPFEEKAIELHEVNAHRTAEGIYDKWVKDSFTALSTLRPGRYGKVELSEVVVDAIR